MDAEFDIIGKTKTSSFASIAEHIKHRLNVYGQLNTRKIAKKTGALNKEKDFTKGELDYYDIDDNFIDDGDIAND